MRRRDYHRLARLSLKSKRRTTVQTIVGISFGLILLFPLLFIVIGFYGGFSLELNAELKYRTHNVYYSSEKTITGKVLCDEEYEKKVDKIFGIKNNLKFDYYYIDNRNNYGFSFSINGGEIIQGKTPGSNLYSKDRAIGVQVIDKECAHRPFIDADYKQIKKPLVSGKVFSKKNSKGEVMVSSRFVSDYRLDAKEIIGSTLSLFGHIGITRNTFSSSEEEVIQPDEYKDKVPVPFFKEYKIVGVYSSNVYYRYSPRYNSLKFNQSTPESRNNYFKDYFWISSASLGDDGEAIAPKKIVKKTTIDEELSYESWYYYENTPQVLAQTTTNAGYAFLPLGLGAYSLSGFFPTYTKSQILEFYTFESARYGYEDLNKLYRLSVTGDPDDIHYIYEKDIASAGYQAYLKFFDDFLYVCIALGTFGGVIFIATLLNLINTLHYSVESMKGFLGICRAEGMKKRGIRRIFLSQINIIFAWAYIATAIFGGGGCVGVKLLFDNNVQKIITYNSDMNITVEWFFIPVALAILLILTSVLSVVISHILVRKVNKTPVLEILSEEGRM